jgi:predicted transcriptional regulator
MLAYTKRTTIKLPDELDAKLRHEAERRGMTISELTREAIAGDLLAQPVAASDWLRIAELVAVLAACASGRPMRS